jgi:SAM-dependent methyltransferase
MATEHQERIDIHTDPRIVHEHVLRYRFALPALEESDVWLDLGCGRGLGAAEALAGAHRPARTLLVDRDDEALKAAREALGADVVDALRIDLSSEQEVAELEQLALRSLDGRRACVTCFEVIEHLDDFVPLVGLLRRIAGAGEVTVVLSVPNDAFWSIHNPHHRTMWSGEAFDEFRMLLPDDAVLAHQYALAGSSVQPLGSSTEMRSHVLPIEIRESGTPTHYLLAFGASAGRLQGVARLTQVDLDAQRAWERQREANLAWLRQREEDLLYYESEARRLAQELDALRTATSAT